MTAAGARVRKIAVLAVAIALLGALFLYGIGIDALEGNNDVVFFVDAPTYHKAARGQLDYILGAGDLVSVAANYLGPVLLIRLTGDNYYALLALNIALFYFAVTSIASSLGLNAFRYALLLFVNPITLSSLLAVNKEIISLVFVALLLRAYTRRSALSAVGAAIASALVRWQLTLMLPLIWVATTRLNPLRRHRGLVLVVLLAVLSVGYMQLAALFGGVRETFWAVAEEYEGSGLYAWLVGLQDRGLYWAVFPLKAAHLLFGIGLRFDRLLDPTEIYNDVWQLLHSTALLAVFIALCLSKRIRLHNDLIYLSLLYVAFFALTPIYAPRYFYPVYVLWAAALLAQPGIRFLPRHSRSPALHETSSAPGPLTHTGINSSP